MLELCIEVGLCYRVWVNGFWTSGIVYMQTGPSLGPVMPVILTGNLRV